MLTGTSASFLPVLTFQPLVCTKGCHSNPFRVNSSPCLVLSDNLRRGSCFCSKLHIGLKLKIFCDSLLFSCNYFFLINVKVSIQSKVLSMACVFLWIITLLFITSTTTLFPWIPSHGSPFDHK